MLEYIHSTNCREQVILDYFSEKKAKPCKRCDLCKGSQDNSFSASELTQFYRFLQDKLVDTIPVFDIIHWWPLNKRAKVISMLSVLENEKKIELNNRKIRLL